MNKTFNEYKKQFRWVRITAFIIYLLFVGFFIWGTYYTCVRNPGLTMIWVYSIYVCCFTSLLLFPQIYSFVILLRNIFKGSKIFTHYDQIVSTTIITNIAKVAIVYVTCNDFIEKAFLTALNQDYSNCKVFILDDSTSEEYKAKIDVLLASRPNQFEVIRRTDGSKNKAGNLNNFLTKYGANFDYVAVQDSDTYLTRNFVSTCLKYFQNYNDIGIIQGCSYPLTNIQNNFQDACCPNYKADKSYWANDAVATSEGCFTMSIGHGLMYNMTALNKIGGRVPDCVAEDSATTVELMNAGYQTVFACNAMSMDETPSNFFIWKKRYQHWETGNFDFFAKYFGKVVVGKYSGAYKAWILYWVIAAWMTPFTLITFNIFAFVCYYFPINFYPIIPWIISMLFMAFGASFVPQKNKASKGKWYKSAKNGLTLACASMSIMPSTLVKFFALFFTKKTFKVTSKEHQRIKWYETLTKNWIDHLGWLMFFTFVVFTCVWTKHWLFVCNPILIMAFVSWISLFIIPYMSNKQLQEVKHNELYNGL